MMQSLKKLLIKKLAKEKEKQKKKRMGIKSDGKKLNKDEIWIFFLNYPKKLQLKKSGPNLKN